MEHPGQVRSVGQRQEQGPVGLVGTRQGDELAVAFDEQRLDLAVAEYEVGLFRLVQQASSSAGAADFASASTFSR
jgi:hypothetical protein